MSTFETQYKNYLQENPESNLTFEEFKLNFTKIKGIDELVGKVCINCEHFASLIGIGQGLRCLHPNKEREPIPHTRHTCYLFEYKKRNNGNKKN